MADARKVLIVDDDETLLRALARPLAKHYAVTTTTSSVEALRLIETGERFDAIVCDLRMPWLDGAQLARAIAEQAPMQASRIIFVTGAGGDPAAALPPGAQVLTKPVNGDALREAVARVAP
jgi:CheY-like chemotaxis protein